MRTDGELRKILLVEGVSDRIAIETLAERCRFDLTAEGVSVIAIGGATQIGTYLDKYGPGGLDLRLAGLFDAGEAEVIGRSLGRVGFGSNLTPGDMESLGFFMCVDDLEDELIRSLEMDAVEKVAESAGDLRSFRIFQDQPAWRGRPFDKQFRRFLGAGARRKIRYASLLVQAMDLARTPEPLESVIQHVRLGGEATRKGPGCVCTHHFMKDAAVRR